MATNLIAKKLMKNEFKIVSIIVVSLLIIVSATFFVFHRQITAYFFPKMEQIGEVKIKIENDTAYVISKLKASNKSLFKLKIDTIKYTISLHNKVYLKSSKFVGLSLLARGVDTFDFSVKIPYLSILTDLKARRKIGDSAAYSIHLFFHYSSIFGKAEVPITKVGVIKIPQAPDLEIVELQYKGLHLKSIHTNAKLKITNYNAIGLSMKGISYSLKVSGHELVKGENTEAILIQANGMSYIELPIAIDSKNLIKAGLGRLLKQENNSYTLTLKANIESIDSMQKYFHLQLSKIGTMSLKK